MNGCSSKRKAKASPATCQLDGSATKRKAEEVEASKEVAGDGGDGEEAPAREGYTRLQQDEVDMILSLEACSMKPDDEETLKLFSQKTIDETSEAISEAAEVSEASKQKFLEFQDFVRGELEEKGYVEVPDEFLISRAELQDWLQEEVDKMFASLDIPDRYFANDSDDDEEEEVAL
ncbi:hypothetical protein ACP70R_007639 [Stipagrostis hirtigluma subsp. patula]